MNLTTKNNLIFVSYKDCYEQNVMQRISEAIQEICFSLDFDHESDHKRPYVIHFYTSVPEIHKKS